jgi:hypothetical protein
MMKRFAALIVACFFIGSALAAEVAEKKGPGPLPRKAPAQSNDQKPPGGATEGEGAHMPLTPAPASGSMPTGPAPSGKLGTEPPPGGRLGTDPKPGDPDTRPPRFN